MKKFLLIVATSLLSLLLAIPSTVASENVLDVEGKPMYANAYYRIMAVNKTLGGGIVYESKSATSPCPRYLTVHEWYPGHPIMLKYIRGDERWLFTDVDINLDYKTMLHQECTESNVWQLAEVPGKVTYITSGGVAGQFNQDTSKFKIKKVENSKYKLVWCPDDMSGIQRICLNLGLVTDNGKSFLAINDGNPLLVEFKIFL